MRHEVIDIDRITANPNQPRKVFDRAALEELADSIRSCGLLQPITVRPVEGAYQIIAGERRFRATQLAGLTVIDAMVIDGVADEQAFVLATLENVARRDMRPIEEAHAYAAISAMGKTPEEIGALVGKAAFAVSWRLELLNLAAEYQDIELPMNVGRLMSRMSIEGQRSVMHRYMGGEFKTTQECERFCNAVIAREAQVDMFDADQLDAFGQDDLRRERAHQTRGKIAGAWSKVTTIAAAFGPIDETGEQDIADALDGDIDRYLTEMRALEAHVRRARIKLENAKAMQKIGD